MVGRFAVAWVLCLIPLATHGASRPSSNSALTIESVSAPQAGVGLSWSPLGAAYAYTVQMRDGLSGNWSPVPANVWPINLTSWKDTLPADAQARFYQVSADATPVTRGKLLSARQIETLSPGDIQGLFNQAGLALPPGSAVNLYKLAYETINPFGVRAIASGLLVLPENPTNALPLASYQHGTIVLKQEVPSSALGIETDIGLALGTSGYAAVLPDYLGLGDSPGLHPFVHAKSEATAAVDMLRAARAFCASNSVALNGQLFLLGYSEGGHATMALHRELEQFHTNEFTITASAPMAGPYDLSGTMVNDFLSGRAMPNPYYFLYLLVTYQSIYHFADSLSDVLVSPYNTILPPLLDGLHDGSVINQAMISAVPTNVLRPEFLASFRANPNHPLRLALAKNDVYEWTPRAPMRLYHCGGDQDVLLANSQVALNWFNQHGAPQVQLIGDTLIFDHTDCAPIVLLAAKLWFDTLKTP
jgi:pimeloyl-ACP methyl ester carboxylesterase